MYKAYNNGMPSPRKPNCTILVLKPGGENAETQKYLLLNSSGGLSAIL